MDIRAYFLSVSSAAIICGILKGLLNHGGTPAQLVKLLSGILLSLVALRPLAQMDIDFFSKMQFDYSLEAGHAAIEGENISAEAISELIKSNTEAYILDKAKEMGLLLQVEVYVSGEGIPVPQKVFLYGSVSPYARAQLSSLLTEQLGIAEEDLIWTG